MRPPEAQVPVVAGLRGWSASTFSLLLIPAPLREVIVVVIIINDMV